MSSIRDFIRDALAQADHLLLALCAAVNLFGIALIYSATRYDASLHSYPVKQAIAMVIGVVLFFLISQLDIDMVLSKWPWLFAASALFIALLAVPGITSRPSRSPSASVSPGEWVV